MPVITFLNRVYPPVPGATGEMLALVAEGLAARGWDVTVVTTGEADATETVRGVRVERVAAAPLKRSSHLRRALAYLALYPRLWRRALRLPRPDVLVTKTDPPLLLVPGALLPVKEGGRRVHWAQDLYPEVAEALGVLPAGGALAGALRRLSTWALRRHDHVVAVGRCMESRLSERGIEEENITVIPNPPPAGIHPVEAGENAFRMAHGLGGRFVVMYSGNLGLAHPFETILGAAALLEKMIPEAVFVFVGDGPRRPWVEAESRRCGLGNVRFLPFQPREHLSASLGAADVHLASMHAAACGLVVPSKVYGILAAGRPCVFLGPPESEAARILREHDAGDVLSGASAAALAGALAAWHADPEHRRAAGHRAHAAISGARNAVVDGFESVARG